MFFLVGGEGGVKESWSLKKIELGALNAQNKYLGAVPTQLCFLQVVGFQQTSLFNKENWGFLLGGKWLGTYLLNQY